MAPRVAQRLCALAEDGRLQVVAARVERLEPSGQGLRARFRRRGQGPSQTRGFAAAVNCTGFSGDLTETPLFRDLASRGLLRPDPLRLGIDVDDRFRVLGSAGTVTAGLFAVGPLTRGARWESVAVPDLRGQTEEVATTVLEHLAPARAGAA
jgi:uncharacterized NAD(P)/FAD-binding protein YdhS